MRAEKPPSTAAALSAGRSARRVAVAGLGDVLSGDGGAVQFPANDRPIGERDDKWFLGRPVVEASGGEGFWPGFLKPEDLGPLAGCRNGVDFWNRSSEGGRLSGRSALWHVPPSRLVCG